MQGPSSLEVTVIHKPVVTVVKEKIVTEEILDNDKLNEVVFSKSNRDTDREKDASSASSSQELRGALTEAEPLSDVNSAPPYPRIARQKGWEGIVRLEVFVDKDGIPESVDVQKSSGYSVLDKAALQAVKKWKFSPAKSGSMRFSSKIAIPIQFTLVKER